MRNITCLLLVIGLILSGRGEEANQQPKSAKLIFYIEQQVQQEQDFIQLSVTVRTQQSSLTSAMKNAQHILDGVKSVSENYCKDEGGQDCQNVVEIDNFDVQFKYQRVRREPKFVGFVVRRDAAITVMKTDNFGVLVDKILALGVYKINKAEWKPLTQIDAEETAIDAGIKQGTDLCHHLNKQLGQVLLIEEIYNDGGDGEEGGEQEQDNGDDEQADEESPAVLKFEVECVQKAPQEKKVVKKKKK